MHLFSSSNLGEAVAARAASGYLKKTANFGDNKRGYAGLTWMLMASSWVSLCELFRIKLCAIFGIRGEACKRSGRFSQRSTCEGHQNRSQGCYSENIISRMVFEKRKSLNFAWWTAQARDLHAVFDEAFDERPAD